MRLLPARHLLPGDRFTPQPQRDEGQPASDSGGDAGDPRPGAADSPAAGPLVVGEVADGDGVLLLDVREEGPLVVDFEVEDAVLVGELEGRGVDGGVGRRGGGDER